MYWKDSEVKMTRLISPKNHGFELGRIAISLCGQFFYKRTGVDFHDLGDSTTKINLFAHLR